MSSGDQQRIPNHAVITKDGIHLIYQYFQVRPVPQQGFNDWLACHRQTEYDECLQRNLEHPHVKGVHILLEREDEETSLRRAIRPVSESCQKKLTIQPIGRRMLYSDAFQYANERLAGSLCVILNADIFLGELDDTVLQSAVMVNANNIFDRRCWSLTRHEKSVCLFWKHRQQHRPPQDTECGCPFIQGQGQYFGSHDSFWFVSPIAAAVVEHCHHVQNRWGAEHKVIHELLRHGYQVDNPSRSVRTFHNHDSDVHPWRLEPGGGTVLADPRAHPPIPPTYLEEML